jgi:hypothetical protein
MGSIKLHMEPIINTVKDKCSEINNSFQNIMTLVTLVCNSTTSKYEGDSRPRVRVTQDDMSSLFCMTLEHNCLVCHSRHSRESMALQN